MDLEKESKGLFDAWENYWKAIEFSFYQGKREGLEEFDKEFKKIIQPLILSFFERNPHIRRGRGYPEDLKIYREFTKPFRVPKRGEGYPGHEMISLDNYSFRNFLDGYYQGRPILPRVACIEKAEDVQKFYREHSTQEDNGRDYLRNMWERYYNFFWSLIEREKTLQAILVPRTLKLATSQAREGEGKPIETYQYLWEFDSERLEVKCNGKGPVHLEPRLFDLLKYLHRKKRATLERIKKGLEIKEAYKHLTKNRLSKLISALDKEAKVLGLKKGEIKSIIERKRDGRKLVKVIFHAS